MYYWYTYSFTLLEFSKLNYLHFLEKISSNVCILKLPYSFTNNVFFQEYGYKTSILVWK
jgi:hypothetical protein